jgi:hypothetical protein
VYCDSEAHKWRQLRIQTSPSRFGVTTCFMLVVSMLVVSMLVVWMLVVWMLVV